MHKIIYLAISLILFPIVNLDNFIYHIVTTPAEDSRYGVTINYHCAFPKSCIEYTTANDKEFKEAKTVSPQVELWSTRGIEKTSTTSTFYTKERYVCHVTLTSLKPNTQYIYRIIANAQISEVKSFKTASGKEKWNFVAFTDFQHYNNAVTHPLIQNMEEKFNPPLAICSGDMGYYYAENQKEITNSGQTQSTENIRSTRNPTPTTTSSVSRKTEPNHL